MEASEAPALSPETLVAQFAARTVYVIGEASDERLTSSYWLNVPSASGEDDVNDSELVRIFGYKGVVSARYVTYVRLGASCRLVKNILGPYL